jgi:hypothetical protein
MVGWQQAWPYRNKNLSHDEKPMNRDQTGENKKKSTYIYDMKQRLQNEQK